jgi:gas vesicle protein
MATQEQACIVGALAGAAVGAALGYLYATEAGARRRLQLVDAFDRLMVDADEAHRLWLRISEAWARFEQAGRRPLTPTGSAGRWPPEDAA